MSRPSDNDYAIDAFVNRAIRDGHLVEAAEFGRAVAHADHLQGEIEELRAMLAHLRRDETQEAIRWAAQEAEDQCREAWPFNRELADYEDALRALLLEPGGKGGDDAKVS